MKKYYRIELNCARVKDRRPFSNDCGFIRVLPVKGYEEKKTIFGGSTYVSCIEYTGTYNVIAELEDDHFKDAVLGNIIEYDPNGLEDITTASVEELKDNLVEGLTCYRFSEIEEEIARFYIDKVIYDEKALSKYILELEEISKKENIKKELRKRGYEETSILKSEKVLKKRRKSA